MFLGDFHPFGNSCHTLSVSQNSLASAIFEFIENDAQIYTSQRYPIEKALLERIKNGSYDNIPATKAFENLLVSHKKYIVESLNKIKMFVATHGKLTTLKLNKDIRRHISCLLVNNFLQENEHEIKHLTDEGEEEEPDNYDKCEYCDDFIIECECPICCHCDEKKGACKCFLFLNKNEKKEIIIEKEEIITFSRCGRCENTLKTCICYSNLVVQLDSKIEAQKKEIYKMEDEQAEYIKEERKRLWEIINELKEDNKAQEEIINSHQPVEKECNDEINKLKARIIFLEQDIENKDKHNGEMLVAGFKLNEENARFVCELKEKTQIKKDNTRLKNKLVESEKFRLENAKAVIEAVDETYKLNADLTDARTKCIEIFEIAKEKDKQIEKQNKENFLLKQNNLKLKAKLNI